MNYRLTVLTPLLVGDGHKLAPIDYMIWKDQVNVLDQSRIFRLLAKGPRLEGYLTQLRRADKLDFASWGGFAQNYAERRIPLEHGSMAAHWNSAPPEQLHIPTFASGPSGAFLPGSALKGALRTGFAFSRVSAGVIKELGNRMEGDRPLRRPGEAAESMAIGAPSNDPMRTVGASDSAPVPYSAFRVYLVRVATLVGRGEGNYQLAWKQAPRGNTQRPDESNPAFVEMAVPGTVFNGAWKARKEPDRLFRAANDHAAKLLEMQLDYAKSTRMDRVQRALESLQSRLDPLRKSGNTCLLNMGWAGGFLSKAAFLDTASEDYRKLLGRLPYYERAIRSGMPFPKTRRVVFEANQPATFPGWALLEIS